MDHSFITQSGDVFIDMGLATGIGVYIHGLLSGGKIYQSWVNVIAAFVGGSLAGVVQYLPCNDDKNQFQYD